MEIKLKHPFNIEFCLLMEYHLSKTLQNTGVDLYEYFWCDGIKMPDDENVLNWDSVKITKQITTNAWFGPTGQDIYQMTFCLGAESLRLYANQLNLFDGVPGNETNDWMIIDTDKKHLKVQLK